MQVTRAGWPLGHTDPTLLLCGLCSIFYFYCNAVFLYNLLNFSLLLSYCIALLGHTDPTLLYCTVLHCIAMDDVRFWGGSYVRENSHSHCRASACTDDDDDDDELMMVVLMMMMMMILSLRPLLAQMMMRTASVFLSDPGIHGSHI